MAQIKHFNGKPYWFSKATKTKTAAKKKAAALRKRGIKARIVPASKHSRTFGDKYDVFRSTPHE